MGALPRQMVDMPFSKGLNTKADPFQIPLGDLLVLQNAVFTAPGKLQKRNGYAALVQSILGGGSIVNPTALFSRGNELCQIGGAASQTLYSYDASNAAWATKGNMPSVGVSIASAAQPQYSTYAIDMAVAANGLQCFAYELVDTNAGASPVAKGLGYAIIDPTTGLTVVASTTLDATTTTGNPRVVYIGGNFVCYYVDTATDTIKGRTLSAASPSAGWSAATTITSGTTTNALAVAAFNFDATVDSSSTGVYLVFPNRSATATVYKLLSAFPLALSATITLPTVAAPITTTIFPDSNGNLAVGFVLNSTTAIWFAVVSNAVAVVKGLTALVGVTAVAYSAITGACTAAGELTFFYSSTTGVAAQFIDKNTAGGATYATIGTSVTLIRSLSLAAKAFTISGVAYVPGWYCVNTQAGGFTRVQSPQNGIYTIDSSGRLIAKALIGSTGALDTISVLNFTSFTGYLLGSTIVSGTTVTLPVSNTNVLQSVITNARFGNSTPGTVTSILFGYQYGTTAVTLKFADAVNGYQRQEIANAVHVNGGILQMYDGQNVVEHGFLIFPESVTAVAAGSGGAMNAGTVQYVFTYEWMDGQGQVHRSTPSTPVSVTVVNNDRVTLGIPTLRLTGKAGVLIQGYRTIANGTVFYQITNFNGKGSLYNDPTANTASWVDSQADSAILANPQLYTTGGVLENAPPPPASAMCVHRNRLFVVDEFGAVWYSKEVAPPAPVEFSGFLKLNIDPKGGKAKALASLDDKLIIFKADRVFMVLGQGPDSTGANSDFTDAILVSADTGCSVPKSVVIVPDGLMFQGPKGIYLLDRALRMSYIGAGVQGLLGPFIGASNNVNLVTSAVLMPDRTEVRFGLSLSANGVFSGTPLLALTYDYMAGQWSSVYAWESQGGDLNTDACISAGNYYAIARARQSVVSDTANVFNFQDSAAGTTAGIQQHVTTGWIKLSGLQGFQRAYRLYVLGLYRTNPHTLNVSVAYDYDSTIAQTTSFAVNSDPAPYQFRVDFARQKCEAIQITISDTIGGNSPSVDLTGLTLEVGIKKGPYKLPAAKGGG